jgi:CheY-like chemotaxis protein
MTRALIIDDEPLARMVVLEYLQAFPQIEVLQECGDGFEGLKAIQQHQPDLIFLDVQMPKINGFEMLELVDNPPAVIFATAFDEFAIKAFEAHALDYLLKPFSKERFVKAIDKFLSHSNTAPGRCKNYRNIAGDSRPVARAKRAYCGKNRHQGEDHLGTGCRIPAGRRRLRKRNYRRRRVPEKQDHGLLRENPRPQVLRSRAPLLHNRHTADHPFRPLRERQPPGHPQIRR